MVCDLFSLLILLLYLFDFCLILGYMGCFVNDLTNHEFNSFAAHLDPNQMTPQLCVKACSAISYNLAAIENGTWCFCKEFDGISSTQDVDANCQSISCAGDPAISCGSENYILVYAAGPLSTVRQNST